MKRLLLLMICLLCCLLFTACYQDNDPWPASASLNAQPTVSVTAYATPEPTAAPTSTPEPAPVIVEETAAPERTPGGDAGPGING